MRANHPLSFLRFLAGVIPALVLALVLFCVFMRPEANEIALMVGLMGATALVSVLAAYAAYRVGWISRYPSIHWALMSGYALSGLLVFLNIWVIARLMFASRHDLILATILLIFATGIAMSLGYLLSAAITDRIVVLNQAARQIAQGWLDTRVPVTGNDEMAGLSRAFNDMAAQLEAMEDRQREMEGLRRDLIAWIGHDLRTPLTSIRAIIEALADGMVDDKETVERYLRTAHRDVCSLSHLIDDLFDIAEMDAGGLRLEIGLNCLADLISDTIESFTEIAIRSGVKLEGRVSPGVDPVRMDAQRVGRVLSNLVANALRYTPRGSSVTVNAHREGSGILVEVVDTGEGIKAEDLPFVFERFYRGEKSRNRATGGSGLGLAIARGLVEAHGGEIGVNSDDSGTRFYFTLPDSTLDEA
jgi:signal transduction histidine kinase